MENCIRNSDPAFCLRLPFEKRNSEDRTGEGILNPYANETALHHVFTKKNSFRNIRIFARARILIVSRRCLRETMPAKQKCSVIQSLLTFKWGSKPYLCTILNSRAKTTSNQKLYNLLFYNFLNIVVKF